MSQAAKPPLLTESALAARQPIVVSPSLTLSSPLSRRGNGPALILLLDHDAPLGWSETGSVDPPPLMKWAEEGFAVAQVLVGGEEWQEKNWLERILSTLSEVEGCDGVDGVGVISYLTSIPKSISHSLCTAASIKAIISYNGQALASSNNTTTPQLIHKAGPPQNGSQTPSPHIKTHYYPSLPPSTPHWVLPASPAYHAPSIPTSHTHTLTFLKPLLGGPYFDLSAIWDEHCYHEFATRDVAATMATMVAQPYVNHIPTMTGGVGKAHLARFYENHFVHANPEDTRLDVVGRVVGVDRVVDEFVMRCTHDKVIDWLLPSLPPTNLPLAIPMTAIITMRGDRLAHEHISWDQATVLRQLGLLPEWVPFPYAYPLGRDQQGENEDERKKKEVQVRLPVLGIETVGMLEGTLGKEEKERGVNMLIDTPGVQEEV